MALGRDEGLCSIPESFLIHGQAAWKLQVYMCVACGHTQPGTLSSAHFNHEVAFGTPHPILVNGRVSTPSAARLLSSVQPSPGLLGKQRRLLLSENQPVLPGA